MTQHRQDLRAWLASQPGLGWQAIATPVTALALGLGPTGPAWLGVKRDDLGTVLHGGTKVRKLDALLAAEPWYSAPKWSTVGALGSGHVVACVAAAAALGRAVSVDLFGEPLLAPLTRDAAGRLWRQPSAGVLDNLAWTLDHAAELHFHRGRWSMALTAAPVLGSAWFRGGAVIPPGATVAVAMTGILRGALELADQIERGELPCPDRVYVALGSGGTAAGLALGFGLAGVPTVLHAVRTVEAPLATRARLDRLVAALRRHLIDHGLVLAQHTAPVPVVVDGSQIGRGYGRPTVASQRARMQLNQAGVPAEDVYTGKAFAALWADATQGQGRRQSWLFWNTVRGPLPPAPVEPAHLDRAPRWLQRRVQQAQHPNVAADVRRRRMLVGAGLTLASLAVLRTLPGHVPGGLGPWQGRVLSAREAATLWAATAALLDLPLPAQDRRAVVVAIDAYVASLGPAGQRDVHLLLAAVEHCQPGWHRFSVAPPAERLAHLLRLRGLGGSGRDLWAGLRDLVMLGWYQQPAAWPALGYAVPLVPSVARPRRPAYAALTAPAGMLPPWRVD